MLSKNPQTTTTLDANFARKKWALKTHPDKNRISAAELEKRVNRFSNRNDYPSAFLPISSTS